MCHKRAKIVQVFEFNYELGVSLAQRQQAQVAGKADCECDSSESKVSVINGMFRAGFTYAERKEDGSRGVGNISLGRMQNT